MGGAGAGLSMEGILSGRGLELNLPLEDAGARGGGFSLGHVAGGLQADGESGVGQGIRWGQGSERQGSADGLIELAGVAEGANETMVGLDIFFIGGDGGAKGLSGFGGMTVGEQVKAAL